MSAQQLSLIDWMNNAAGAAHKASIAGSFRPPA
jgi:hypothetical protein